VIDWQRNKELLLEYSESPFRDFFSENTAIAAIGYVYEFGRGTMYFDTCANSVEHARRSLAEYIAEHPEQSSDHFRWNSGDYDWSGGAIDVELSEEWESELSNLDQVAEDATQSEIVHSRFADICCEVLAELAKRGIFGDWSVIDFNVAALLDSEQLVKKRDQRIRDLIRGKS